jgi:hypothetical protein
MGSLAAVLASFGRLFCCGAPCRQSVHQLLPRRHLARVALAKELHGQRMSLRKIAAELAARGHLTAYGKPYVASAVQSMLG